MLAALVLAALAVADARDPRADVDVLVPVDPHEHERLHFFGKRDHHVVPGMVTINGTPYVCDLDGSGFKKRDDFEAHLRSAHRVDADAIRARLVERDGALHFIAE